MIPFETREKNWKSSWILSTPKKELLEEFSEKLLEGVTKDCLQKFPKELQEESLQEHLEEFSI